MPRAKYAMDYRPIDSFSMSYASRKVIFPGESEFRGEATLIPLARDYLNC